MLLVALTAAGIVPLALLMSSFVTGIEMLAEPLKLVAVPVAPPEIAIVLAVVSVEAEPALPTVMLDRLVAPVPPRATGSVCLLYTSRCV